MIAGTEGHVGNVYMHVQNVNKCGKSCKRGKEQSNDALTGRGEVAARYSPSSLLPDMDKCRDGGAKRLMRIKDERKKCVKYARTKCKRLSAKH